MAAWQPSDEHLPRTCNTNTRPCHIQHTHLPRALTGIISGGLRLITSNRSCHRIPAGHGLLHASLLFTLLRWAPVTGVGFFSVLIRVLLRAGVMIISVLALLVLLALVLITLVFLTLVRVTLVLVALSLFVRQRSVDSVLLAACAMG